MYVYNFLAVIIQIIHKTESTCLKLAMTVEIFVLEVYLARKGHCSTFVLEILNVY